MSAAMVELRWELAGAEERLARKAAAFGPCAGWLGGAPADARPRGETIGACAPGAPFAGARAIGSGGCWGATGCGARAPNPGW